MIKPYTMKHISLLLLVVIMCMNVFAQTAITHLSGAQIINGVTVTVTRSTPPPKLSPKVIF